MSVSMGIAVDTVFKVRVHLKRLECMSSLTGNIVLRYPVASVVSNR